MLHIHPRHEFSFCFLQLLEECSNIGGILPSPEKKWPLATYHPIEHLAPSSAFKSCQEYSSCYIFFSSYGNEFYWTGALLQLLSKEVDTRTVCLRNLRHQRSPHFLSYIRVLLLQSICPCAPDMPGGGEQRSGHWLSPKKQQWEWALRASKPAS